MSDILYLILLNRFDVWYFVSYYMFDDRYFVSYPIKGLNVWYPIIGLMSDILYPILL